MTLRRSAAAVLPACSVLLLCDSALARRHPAPNERRLDIRRFRLFAKPLERRFDICARKGFDAVEPDNVAGWETGRASRSAPARSCASIAGWRGRCTRKMAIALKNDGGQAKQLLPDFDFAIVEQCFQYDECGLYEPFVKAGKAVFEAEYELEPSAYCDKAASIGFSAIGKSYDLFARPWRPCA